jgi:hypothetical protein
MDEMARHGGLTRSAGRPARHGELDLPGKKSRSIKEICYLAKITITISMLDIDHIKQSNEKSSRMHTGNGQEFPGRRWIKRPLRISTGSCVEAADLPGGQIGVRDGKDSEGPAFRFDPLERQAFLNEARNGEFDLVGGTRQGDRHAAGTRAVIYAVIGGLIVALILALLSHLQVSWH